MPRMIWVHQPEMSLLAAGQQEALRGHLHAQGWEIRLVPYRPRMMWRIPETCDALVWSLVPSALDLWSTRHLARQQIGILHELNSVTTALPQLHHWVVPSKVMEARLLQRGVRAERISVWQALPAASRISPQPLRKQLGLPEETILLYAGGPLVAQTGGKIAMWALNILNYLYPEAHLVLHGSGTEREPLEAFLLSIDQRRRCHFLPECYPASEAIAQANQVWLPRQWEGVPDALYFALQSGSCILASDLPSLREWLTHEQNALLVPPDQPPAWAAAAKRLLEDHALATRLQTAARATPWKRSSPTEAFPQMMESRQLARVA